MSSSTPISVTILQTLIFGGILFLITRKNNRKFMTVQERIDALDARYAKATTGLAGDIRDLTEKVRANTVTEESLARLERRADALDELDAENPTANQGGDQGSEGNGGDSTNEGNGDTNTGGDTSGEGSTEQPL